MAMIECYECKKEISSVAEACPNCGAPAKRAAAHKNKPRTGPFRKLVIVVFWGVVALIVIGLLVGENDTKKAASSPSLASQGIYLDSRATYSEVDKQVGCSSTFSDDKKDDIFESQYKNRWMEWKGKIALLEAGETSIDIDGGLQDLSVKFDNPDEGYDLTKGSTVTVRFLMKSAGGCFLPFGGERARIKETH